MQAHRIIGADPLEIIERTTPLAEIVLAMHLEPADSGPRFEHVAVMLGPQADPG
jgi:hypothetical protein